MEDRTKIGKVLMFLQVIEYFKPREKSNERAGFKLWNPLTWLTMLIITIIGFFMGGIPGVVEYFQDMRIMHKEYSTFKAERRKN